MNISDKIYRHKKGSVYVILLLSYVSILLLTLSSSIIYYAQINRQITTQTEISRQLLLTQLQTTVESGATAVEELCNEIAFDSNIYQFAKNLPSVTEKEVKSLLSSKMYRKDIVYDYFIYLKSTDEIITPTIKMSSRKFYDIIYQFADLSYEDFRAQYLETTHFQDYLPLQTLLLPDDATMEILPFVQTFPVAKTQEPLGQVICLVDAQKLFANVDIIHQSTGSDVYILDKNNAVVTASRDAPVPDISSIDSITSGKISKDAVISKRTAERIGWKFIVQTPTALSFTENRRFLITCLAIFMIYLIAGLILVRFLTNKSYHPISEINSLIRSNAPDVPSLSGSGNEYETIKGTIIHQFQQDKKLNGIINSQLPHVRRAILDRMLKGLVSDYGQTLEKLGELGIVFPCDTFLLVSLEMAKDSPFLQLLDSFEENLILARLSVSNVANELFEEHFFCCSIDYDQQQCVFLLCPKAEASCDEIFSHAMEQSTRLTDFMRQKFQISCFAGISTVRSGPASIPLCFDEARKASEYTRLIKSGVPVSFQDMQNLDENYYYPMEIENQLVSYLKTGQIDQAKELLDKIFRLNTEEKALTSHALKGLLFEIDSTLQKQLNSIHIAKGEAPVAENHFEAFIDSSSLETARGRYFEIMEQISSQSPVEAAASRPEKLSAAIASYIQENAETQWIDLNTLSNEFHVTPQYISNIFKKYQNENIKDYISKAKLDLAKGLLLTTDLSVNEIAQKLGYAGEIGIIRLFKKYEGMTPGDFRSHPH